MNPLHAPRPGQVDLLRMSRDALRRAGSVPVQGLTVATLVSQLGLVSAVLEASERLLATVGDEVRRRERAGVVAAVEGPFDGETATAVATHDLWAARARVEVTSARDAVDSAHAALSGLAER